MTRRWGAPVYGAVVAIAAVMIAAPARGQFFEMPSNDNVVLYDGTVQRLVVAEAAITNAKLYGPAALLEREVLPALRKPGATSVRWRFLHFIDVARVPAQCAEGIAFNCDSRSPVSQPADLFASSIALAHRFGDVGVFVAWGITSVFFPESNLRRTNSFGYGVVTAIVPLSIFIEQSPALKTQTSSTADAIAGVQVETAGSQLRLGYAASQGLFTNVSQEKLRLFATGILGDRFSELDYLRAGFHRLPWTFVGDAQQAIGETSVFARKLVLFPPRVVEETLDAGSYRRLGGVDLWTGHLEHRDLFGMLDALGAWTAYPSSELHEVRVSLHTRGYALRPDQKTFDEHMVSAAVTVGRTRLPDLFFYGVEGGYKLSAALEVVLRFPSGFEARAGVRRNEPELLAYFPFAQDAWATSLVVGTPAE